ncbi:protein MpSUK1 [Marchantia polymorpha subsp. ruderalis]|uniref:Uncharacterized protein n=2 Tax=Marchantia polymorpha TaxID=3197 RepID=A0AAF6BDU6_MARPO|nr:hypothetical protein MARPO_0175s0019 [Marchantia polymorpha]BBN10180.1 hypothetical protein Mp_5g01590 [Marchantia polymorpha subsp. ruderalis]|eukprot:PTQ28058.1 hypothetical protein MARPO_0175s0019 [Marchantia polymorpha]
MAAAGKAAPAAGKPAAVPAAGKATGSAPAAAKTGASQGSKSPTDSSKSVTASSGSGSAGSAGAKKPSLKAGDPAAALVVLGPDGLPVDPASLPPVEEAPPPPPPKPYLGTPPPRWLRPPWEKAPRDVGPLPPRFVPYSRRLLEVTNLRLPPQIEFQDAMGVRTMIKLKKTYPRLIRLHIGRVGVTFEKHAGPVQIFLEVLCQDLPEFPELINKPQFSTCNFYPMR